MALIKKCSCIHPAQDALYGIGMRLHTKATKGSPPHEERCTVCFVKTYGIAPSTYRFSTRTLAVVGSIPDAWKAIRS